MAAIRVVLSKAKSGGSWGYGVRGKLGSLGGISNSSVLSRLPSVNQSCRHYFLPPPPPRSIIQLRAGSGYHFPVANNRIGVVSLAKYAVKCQNNTLGGDLRFVRVVRATAAGSPGRTSFYMTLEAFDNKAGELNVYYAQVYHRPAKNIQLLQGWQLVDEDFYYPFREASVSDRLRKNRIIQGEIDKNTIVGEWLSALTPLNPDFPEINLLAFGERERSPDPLRPIFDFEKKFMLNTDCQPCPPENASYPSATIASDFVATVYRNWNYTGTYRYAYYTVLEHNKNEGDEIHLEEVLWASKSKAEKGAHYFLLLEAMDKKKELQFYYAIIKVYRSEVELMEWHHIPESSYCPLQNEE